MKAFDNFYALNAKTKLKVLNEFVRIEPEKHISLLEECLEDRSQLPRLIEIISRGLFES